MALQKQSINVNFSKGLDLKTEKNQVAMDKFLVLENATFATGAGLTKRAGFGNLTTLANPLGTTLTTLHDNLIATGSVLQSYSASSNQWLSKGITQPVSLSTRAAVRNSTSQSGVDVAIALNGLECAVWQEGSSAYYQIAENVTGEMIVNRTQLPATAADPRVNTLANYFIISFTVTVAGSPHLRYIAIPVTTPTNPGTPTDISAQVKSVGTGWDAHTVGNSLYYVWNGSDGGGAVRVAYLSSTLVVSAAKIYAGFNADLAAVTADMSTSSPLIWISFWDDTSNNGWAAACTQQLVSVLAPTQVITALQLSHLTMLAKNGTAEIIYDVQNSYPYTVPIRTDYINHVFITQAGVVGSTSIVSRSVALASKAFYDTSGIAYILTAFGSALQPSYFLMDTTGNVVMKLAYSNGGGYVADQVLSNVVDISGTFYLGYQFKDLLVAVNKSQGLANVGGIYTQTGLNIATIRINESAQYSSEIALSLHLTGGFTWQYDAVKPVEHGFHVWPEEMQIATSAVGGLITAQQYYYVFCYEWTDSQGMLHRSAPTIPIGVVTAGATSTNTIAVPMLRLTYKITPNPVRLVGYRWSTAQQNYYQFTSVSNPVLNDPSTDFIGVVDTSADSAIIGNTLLYTTGGVLENIASPAGAHSTLSQNRMWVLDSEDRNLAWYSKLVIESTPVEFSDLQTIFIAPTTGAQGSSGELTCLASMDDKTIFFKANALYYITGKGPDITGANNDFSEPTYITSATGCNNPASLVLTPQGIMFQGDKGIWLLGRDLGTRYIGADVESFNSDRVVSALCIPGTNEVRFSMASGAVLMYDYYYNQWGTYTGIPAISSTLYQGLHTYLNSLGQVRQQTPGLYLDGTSPVLMKFSTAWLKLTGLQGYQRSYALYLLSQYLTPYKLNVQIGYDYQPGISQQTILTPNIGPSTYGSDTLWGGSGVNGNGTGIDQKRVFLNQQRCQALQVTVTEIFDASKGTAAGAGLNMSGINVLIGAKATKPTISAAESAG